MKLTNYLTFSGQAEDALKLYQKTFDGNIQTLTRYQDAPFDVPTNYKNKIMYAEFEFGAIQLLVSDIAPNRYDLQIGNHVAFMLDGNDKNRMKDIFNSLATQGTVIEPFEETFWGTVFGMVTDPFDITWKINVSQQ